MANIIRNQNLTSSLQEPRRAHHNNYLGSRYQTDLNFQNFFKTNNGVDINFSINSLRQKSRQKEQQAVKFRTTLLYLNSQKQRKQKTLQLAKRKYQKIIQIRNQAFREKTLLEYEKKSRLEEQMRQNMMKVTKIRQQRNKINESLLNNSRMIIEQAKQIRMQTIDNQKLIKREKLSSLDSNKEKAKMVQQNQQVIKQKLQNFKEGLRQTAKNNYRVKIYKQYSMYQNNEAINLHFSDQLKKQAPVTIQQRQHLVQQINNYESLIGVKTHHLKDATRKRILKP